MKIAGILLLLIAVVGCTSKPKTRAERIAQRKTDSIDSATMMQYVIVNGAMGTWYTPIK